MVKPSSQFTIETGWIWLRPRYIKGSLETVKHSGWLNWTQLNPFLSQNTTFLSSWTIAVFNCLPYSKSVPTILYTVFYSSIVFVTQVKSKSFWTRFSGQLFIQLLQIYIRSAGHSCIMDQMTSIHMTNATVMWVLPNTFIKV